MRHLLYAFGGVSKEGWGILKDCFFFFYHKVVPPLPKVGSHWRSPKDSGLYVTVVSSNKKEIRYAFRPNQSATSSLTPEAFRDFYELDPRGYMRFYPEEGDPF
jgi:hypothetical protein